MPTISYYMTLNSPWSYLGSAKFAGLARKYGHTVDIKPTKFSVVFPQTGGLPLPKRAPARQAYRLMELKRWREVRGLPINIQPKHFPSDEAPGTRLLIAAKLQGKDAHALATEMGRALWEREENLADWSALKAAAARAGLDADAIKVAAPSDAELDKLHDGYTAEALERGVFGAPTYYLESGEFFWGQDRLELLERELAKAK
ncbi:MAG TPA: 2-hydroxychromene-2-carboxylate isomerase [Hyphomicrobiaceae bacterium]|nr:2-hydroxychromene-2-carboxylate isomerase [Hyphomicrobiaceae bacterium]